MAVPQGLKTSFLIHFIVDVLFAIPLIFAPDWVLSLFGLPVSNLVLARLVGSALLGIGVSSLLIRTEHKESFKELLNLKIVWSSAASLSILYSILEGGPASLWVFFAIFAGFLGLWVYWFRRL